MRFKLIPIGASAGAGAQRLWSPLRARHGCRGVGAAARNAQRARTLQTLTCRRVMVSGAESG